jgi:hypothetical protein
MTYGKFSNRWLHAIRTFPPDDHFDSVHGGTHQRATGTILAKVTMYPLRRCNSSARREE